MGIFDTVRTSFSPLVVVVTTGKRKKAGTDCKITIKLHDKQGNVFPEIELDNFFFNDFEMGNTDVFRVPRSYPDIDCIRGIEIFCERSGFNPDWYVEKILIKDNRNAKSYIFPIHRWIIPKKAYYIEHFDTKLPQFDWRPKQRKEEIKKFKQIYEIFAPPSGLPTQLVKLPKDEIMSDANKDAVLWKKLLMGKEKLVMKISKSGLRWDEIGDIDGIYTSALPRPVGTKSWEHDWHFAAQRLNSCCPTVIKLCESIPENFVVTEEMLAPLMEGSSLQELIDSKRLYIVDLKVLEAIQKQEDKTVCTPMGLFFVNKEQTLMPLAIQLFQTPSEDNPVFLPTDEKYLWMLVRMWFNNAQTALHQSLTHLAATHLVMSLAYMALKRNISPSHPIFKLLAPHFLNLLAINTKGLPRLMEQGGVFDEMMTVGSSGAKDMIIKEFKNWRMEEHGILPNDIKNRGVQHIPDYHYRDDATLLWDAIYKYVTDIVKLYYESDEVLVADWEIQDWAAEMSRPTEKGGVDMQGVPGAGKFANQEDLILVCTTLIFTSSVQHGAVNFSQYEDYAYTPSMPALLHGSPPTTKDPVTESTIMQALPSKSETIGIMMFAEVLSTRGTQPLGDFEEIYIYDPEAVKIVENFRESLKSISQTIKNKNAERVYKYTFLDPEEIPNSISI